MIERQFNSIVLFLAALLAASCSPRASDRQARNIALSAVGSAAGGMALAEPAAPTTERPFVMGAASCASSGCHGLPLDGQRRDWPAAYAVWRQEDPHRRAFQVLYTERANEMYRNLNPNAKWSIDPPPDQEYLDFLNASCIGCHATGLVGRAAVATLEPEDGSLFYLDGIGCESCHGPASAWLNSHYLESFSRSTPGFHDTKPLDLRAEVCVGCHVGPMIAASGKPYDVTHDLIAAGHPRLAFEFASYLANLPKHWNLAEDVAQHQQQTRSAAFHSDAWASGQEQFARQLVRQIELRLAAAKRAPTVSPWPDFANYQCLDCHHTIGLPGNSEQATTRTTGQSGAPRPSIGPLTMLRIMSAGPGRASAEFDAAANKIEALLVASWQTPVTRLAQPTTDELTFLTARGQPLLRLARQGRYRQQANWLLARLQLLKQYQRDSGPSPAGIRDWDEVLQLYLGASALARDVEPQGSGPLHDALQPLGESLGRGSFQRLGRPATQYDSPSDFDAGKVAAEFGNLEQVISKLIPEASATNQP